MKLVFVDLKLMQQLNDAVKEVNRKKCKNAVTEMFSIEAALVKKTLIAWFNKKKKDRSI